MVKKVNPRRRPASEADVKKAMESGYVFGFQYTVTLAMYVLKEKHDAPDADIQQFFREMEIEVEDIAKGFSNYVDVKNYVRDELGIEVLIHPGFRPKDFKESKEAVRVADVEDVTEKICDGFCKWPDYYLSEYEDPNKANDMMERERCNGCPLNGLLKC